MVAGNGDTFPSGGVFRIGDAECFGVVSTLGSWLCQEVLKLFEFTLGYLGEAGCARESYSKE